jgi:hypothetical protein
MHIYKVYLNTDKYENDIFWLGIKYFLDSHNMPYITEYYKVSKLSFKQQLKTGFWEKNLDMSNNKIIQFSNPAQLIRVDGMFDIQEHTKALLGEHPNKNTNSKKKSGL